MKLRRIRIPALMGLAASALAATVAIAAPGGTSRGPSTTTDPYVLPVADGVSIKSLLTVSDAGSAGNGYEMVGIPDGLGLVGQRARQRGRDFELLMNHELRPEQGVTRRHGQKGAFVSRMEIDSDTHQVEEGSDQIDPDVRFWDYPSQTYRNGVPSSGGPNPRDPSDTFLAQSAAFARFCSSSITRLGQLFNERTDRGFRGQIYFANEENGDEGRLFGVTDGGQAQQLPRLGLFSWENTLAALNQSDTTMAVGQEDTATGQLWVYAGRKQRTGSPFDRAGLTNGTSFVVDLLDESTDSDSEFRANIGKGVTAKWDLAEVDWDSSGARQNSEAAADGLTLNRIEDGAFDPRNPDDFYFVTTEGSPGTVPSEPAVTRDGGGVWLLHFKNIERPAQGGTLELLLDGTEAPFLNKPDNVGIDRRGNLLIQEDPGNNAQLARIIAYDVDTGDRGVVAEFDPALFRAGGAGFITQDEESSGIIPANRALGRGWWLFDAQVHKANPETDKVEYGQLLAMHIRDIADVYTIDGDD